MTAVIEKTPEGTVYRSPLTGIVPNLDTMTLLFDSEYCCGSEDRTIHVDAADPSISLTKAQLRHQSKQMGRVLRDQYGVGAQGPSRDVVFNISTGNVLLPLLFYGTLVAEGVFSSTSPSATPDELAHQLRQTGPKVIICNADTKANAVAAAEKVGFPPSKVLVYQGERHMELYEAVSGAKVPISNQELDWRRITDPEELANSVICLLYSSGTTGLPKAMKLSHQNLVAESALLLEPLKEFNAANRSKDFVYTNIAHLPVAHIAGVVSYFVTVLYMGGVVYWMPRFDFLKFCEYSKKYKANSMFTVPPIYLLISKMPNVTDQFDHWVDAVSGAAPMGEDLQNAVSKKLCRGRTKVRQTWGLSETTGSFAVLPNDLEHEAPVGTVGTIVPHNYARVIDDAGNDVEPGQEGEIIVKGPVVIKGYWNNPQADAEAFKNGWFYTGDIGAFRDGWLYIVDRKKELIKYKATQVAPAELEAVLLSHPKIQDAAVIGVAGEDTELPRAYVVADPKQVSEQEIKNFVAKQVAPYKQLRGGVVFIPAIPKSPSGKILRKELRELAKKEARSSRL